MMNKALKAKWVKALRSGKYKQGKNRLKSVCHDKGTSFCCLGVLAEIAPGKVEDDGSNLYLDVVSSNISSERQGKLSKYNDVGGKSFKWIAYYIERSKTL